MQLEKAKEKLLYLIDRGEKFTYGNFSSKGEYGYPSAYVPDYIAWKTRVTNIINNLFDQDAAPLKMLQAGIGTPVIGNGEDKFLIANSYYLGALKSAIEVLEDDTFGEILDSGTIAPRNFSNEIFIVHGHDDRTKSELESFLKDMDLHPIILHKKPDEGQTIIEKLERHSNVGYAFIMLTPDEVAYLSSQDALVDSDRVKEKRARPNVIFEFGFFVGKLGRSRVCCLYTGDVTLPSDLDGLLYKKYNRSIEEVAYSIMKELKTCGYKIRIGT
jgi:predicted nucleotide-binding protein